MYSGTAKPSAALTVALAVSIPSEEVILAVALIGWHAAAKPRPAAVPVRTVRRDLIQLRQRQGVTFELILAEELRRRERLFVREGIGWVTQRR